MDIIVAKPPNYDEIVAAIPGAAQTRYLIVTYGKAIYNPSGAKINEELMAHETVHSGRQGSTPDDWWRRYLTDTNFRLAEELVAHAAEYAAFCQLQSDRNRRTLALHRIAARLASPIYGELISFHDARTAILVGA